MNSSKSATYIMLAGNAIGESLSVYVVYKTVHFYDTWVKNGPPKARYNQIKSSWFDGVCFEDCWKKWPSYSLKIKLGSRLSLVNMSCHLSTECIRLCEKYQIKMIFLPTNSTHLTQPLDVAFFAPMKKKWSKIISQWKV